jgi:hypothetical protein
MKRGGVAKAKKWNARIIDVIVFRHRIDIVNL